MTIYDPSKLELFLANVSNLVLAGYYRKYTDELELQENDKVLDFGSGNGYLAKLMSRKLTGKDSWLTCVEISEKWNRVAKKKLKNFGKADFYTGMITELDIKEKFYDKIVIHVVLHDIAKELRQDVVKALAKTLKKKGKLIIRDPTKPSHGMPAEEIRAVMKKAGLVELKSQLTERRFLGEVFDGVFEKK